MVAICGAAGAVVLGVCAGAMAENVSTRSGNQIRFIAGNLTPKCGDRLSADLRMGF